MHPCSGRNSAFGIKGVLFMKNRPLLDYLQNNKRYPFHMPGHKRNPDCGSLSLLGSGLDITEIEGADNLHGAEGVLLSVMERGAALWGSDRSYLLVNGSTGGILAALSAVTRRGDKVLVGRNCHKSVYHGIELLGLRPVFLMPEYVEELGVYGRLDVSTVAEAIAAHGDAVCLVMTSPTYEGYLSDISGISELCHGKGLVLVVDEAHGAHLELSPRFRGGAVRAGADLSVQSLHKTLPALTQTAILHLKGGRVERHALEHALAVFQTSSPSYLLMASAEQAIALAEEQEGFESWYGLIKELYGTTADLEHISLLAETADRDISKLVIRGKDGIELAAFLRRRGIETEYATHSFVLAMTGLGDRREGFELLGAALKAADAELGDNAKAPLRYPCCEGELVMDIETAVKADFELVPLSGAAGRIGAEYVWAYPPGIPLLIPGQPVDARLAALDTKGLHSDRGALPLVAVVK